VKYAAFTSGAVNVRQTHPLSRTAQVYICVSLYCNRGAFGDVVVKALRYLSEGGVTGFFSDIFPSDRTMALGSTQPLVKMSNTNIPGCKGGRCVRLTTSPPSCAECHENLGA
jgi:hypothetical protein